MAEAINQQDVWTICEVMAEIQAVINDHIEHKRYTSAEVATKIEALATEPPLLRAMWAVGYFPKNTPPLTALS